MKTIGFRVAAGIGVTALLLACGQKGPLVLPDAQHPHRKLGVPKPATPSAPQPAEAPSDAGRASPAPATPGNDDPGASTSVPAP